MWKINFQVNNQDVTIQTFLFQFAENHENCKKEFVNLSSASIDSEPRL